MGSARALAGGVARPRGTHRSVGKPHRWVLHRVLRSTGEGAGPKVRSSALQDRVFFWPLFTLRLLTGRRCALMFPIAIPLTPGALKRFGPTVMSGWLSGRISSPGASLDVHECFQILIPGIRFLRTVPRHLFQAHPGCGRGYNPAPARLGRQPRQFDGRRLFR